MRDVRVLSNAFQQRQARVPRRLTRVDAQTARAGECGEKHVVFPRRAGERSRRGAHGLIAACGKGREINVIVGVAGDLRQCVDRRLLDVVVFVAGKRAQ